MTTRRTFRRELTRLGAGRLGGAIGAALWFVVVVRHLGESEVGDLALLLSLGAMFGLLADGGYSIVLQAEVAAAPDSSATALASVRRRRLPLGILAAALTGGVWLVTAQDPDPRVAAVFAISIIATTVYTSAGITMRALGHAGVEGANETISRLLVLAVGWWLLARNGGVLAAAGVYAMADVGSAIVLTVVFARRFGDRRGPVDMRALAPRRVAPIFLAAALGTTYYRVDLLMVHVMKGAPTAALYATSYRVFEAVMLPAGVVAALVLPAVFRASVDQRGRVALRITAAAVGLTLFGAIAIEVFAPTLLRVIFGADYVPATVSLRVLGVATLVTAVTVVLAEVHAVQRPVWLAKVWLVALVGNVALNFVLIPHFADAGAAFATLVCQLGAAVVLILDVRRAAATPAEPPVLTSH